MRSEPDGPGWWRISDTSGHVRYVSVGETTFLDGREAGLIVYLVGQTRPFEVTDRYFQGWTWEKAK